MPPSISRRRRMLAAAARGEPPPRRRWVADGVPAVPRWAGRSRETHQRRLRTMTIDPEAVGQVILTVTASETAARGGLELGESYPEVFATATMVREMERAAAKLMRPL